MTEYVQLPDDWRTQVGDVFAKAWHYESARGLMLELVESWPRVQVPASEGEFARSERRAAAIRLAKDEYSMVWEPSRKRQGDHAKAIEHVVDVLLFDGEPVEPASQVPASEDEDLAIAMHAAETGNAGHWPTVAAVLRDEVLRLRGEPASQSHPKPEVDPEHAKWDTHGDFTSADCGCSRCRPSEPNDWTPTEGDPVDVEGWDQRAVVLSRGDIGAMIQFEDGAIRTYSFSHLRPASVEVISPADAPSESASDLARDGDAASSVAPSEQNDWTPAVGERVEWGVAEQGVVDAPTPTQPPECTRVIRGDWVALIETRHLRPASQDSEEGNQ